jgi:aryl-alcohol dehydrogenase-like predicted oxidoreductase
MGCIISNAQAAQGLGSVSRLALGTVQFGLPYGVANQTGQVSREQAAAMLQLASISGIDTLDTAIAYGDSESCLGAVGTASFRIVTKLPAVPEGAPDVGAWVEQQVTGSLSRLGGPAVDGVLLHRAEQLLEPRGTELYRALERMKDLDLVRKVGISIYAPSALDELLPRYRFDIVQAPFNLVDRRLHTSGWLRRLKDAGTEVHTRSAFLQGLLLMPRADIPAKFAPWGDLWGKWQQWLARHEVTAVQACLAFPLAFPEIDRVIVGADSVSQLEQIICAAHPPAHGAIPDLPDLHCEDENLINPAQWSHL